MFRSFCGVPGNLIEIFSTAKRTWTLICSARFDIRVQHFVSVPVEPSASHVRWRRTNVFVECSIFLYLAAQ